MKTLLITLEYPPQIGGVADYYYNLKNAWPMEQELEVFDTSQDDDFKRAPFYRWLFLSQLLLKRLRRDKIKQVLVGHILPLGPIVALAKKFYSGFSYSVFLHGLDFSAARATWRKKLMSHFVLKGARKIICANSLAASEVRQWQEEWGDKIVVVNPGARTFPPDSGLIKKISQQYDLENKKVIFSLGRLVERKGFDMIIKALVVLRERKTPGFENIKYFIGGQGPDLERLKDLVAKNDFQKQVIFLGTLDQVKKTAWFSVSDVFSMPARNIKGDHEGFGIVYLEANLLGKPVIAGRAGGVADAVLDGKTGLLVNPNDPNELAEAIVNLLNNQELSKKLGEQGRDRAIKEFNWSRQADKLRVALFGDLPKD